MLRVSGATIGLSHRAARDSSLPVTLGFGLQSAEPRDQRVVEEGLHPCGVGIDGVSGEGLGGGYVDTLGGGFEAPLVGARDALRFATPQGAGVVIDLIDGRRDGEAVAGPRERVAGLERVLQAGARSSPDSSWARRSPAYAATTPCRAAP